jgi:tetratricopeptide (TPR) repeat protein
MTGDRSRIRVPRRFARPASILLVLIAAAALGKWGWTGLHPDPVARGEAAYARGHWKPAAAAARERLKVAPHDPRALRLLGRASARLGRDGTALESYSRLGVKTMEAEDDYLLGLAFQRASNFDATLKLWDHSLARDPENPEVLDAVTLLCIRLVRPVAALGYAERLARRPGWEVRGSLIVGMLRAEMNDPAGASRALAEALRRDPSARGGLISAAKYRKMLADCLLQVHRPTEARAALSELLAAGSDAEAAWLLSRADLQSGSDSSASRDLADRAASYRAENPLRPEPSPHVGSARCGDCHQTIGRAHHDSRHARTFLHGAELARLPLPSGPVQDRTEPGVSYTMTREGDAIAFEARAGQTVLRALAEYAFGSDDHYLSLIGHDAGGDDRILRLSYHVRGADRGWDRTTGHAAQPERGDHLLGKPLERPGGLYRCLFCHTTSARSVLGRTGPESADRAIGCERCHGPGGNHLAAVAAKLPDRAIVNPALATAAALTTQLCGQCHSLHGAEGDRARTDPYFLRFEATTLTWSRCYTESDGGLSCITCHDPHRNAQTSDATYEAKCLTCHGAGPRRKACPVNPARGCIGCHMPRTEVKILHSSWSDHYIRVQP